MVGLSRVNNNSNAKPTAGEAKDIELIVSEAKKVETTNVTTEFNGLSRGKDHQINGLDNLDTYCTKRKKTRSCLKNKYCGY